MEIEGWDPPPPLAEWKPNNHLKVKIASCIISLVGGGNLVSTTELDSHANMCVFGSNCWIAAKTGRSIDVGAFAEQAGGLENVPVVDVIVAYDCLRTGQVFLFIAKNVLYVESMDDNLVPPFILREAGLDVRDKPKIHCPIDELTEEDHTIQDKDSGLLIPLRLRSTFSIFKTRKPTEEELDGSGIPVMLTPNASEWMPYCTSYAENEDALINKKGELRPPEYVQKTLVDDYDLPTIDSVLGMDIDIDRSNDQAVISAFRSQDVEFTEETNWLETNMSDAAAFSEIPFNLISCKGQ